MAALLTGATNKDIAARLGLTEQSVKNRLWSLYRKTGVANRLQLAVLWVDRPAPDQSTGHGTPDFLATDT